MVTFVPIVRESTVMATTIPRALSLLVACHDVMVEESLHDLQEA
jgi:hypothetical protein